MTKNTVTNNGQNKLSRLPTGEEKQQLEDYFIAEISWRATVPEGTLRKEIAEMIEDAYVAVFDNYTTLAVAYTGKVMVMLYNDMPMHADVFIIGQKGQLIRSGHTE